MVSSVQLFMCMPKVRFLNVDSEEKQMLEELLARIVNLELKNEAYGEKLASCEHTIDELGGGQR